ncbi:helix-turn-helix transcriptional regulator [Aquabacterium sp.]|uniref:helix-turn-helix transcriptional regulator n=1 Tax=Aquabacterium sp. TaxID=1872578 RepID=UPI0035B1C946
MSTNNDALLRLPEVLAIIPVSRTTWYQGVKDGLYPQQVKLGPRVSAWRRSDIDALLASLGARGHKHGK